MSFADSLEFPRQLNIVIPSSNQSAYTQNFDFSGSYNGSLAGALIAFPKQGVGAQAMFLKSRLVWGVPNQNPFRSISNAIYACDKSIADSNFADIALGTHALVYVPIVRSSTNPGTGTEVLWDCPAQTAVEETHPTYSTYPRTVSARCNSLFMHVERNTISSSSVAISGSCHAARFDQIELYGDLDLGPQYMQRYACPDKDFKVNVPQQNGVCGVAGIDYGGNYRALNPWGTGLDKTCELAWRSPRIVTSGPSTGLSIGTVLWVSPDIPPTTKGQFLFGNLEKPILSAAMTAVWLSPYVDSKVGANTKWATIKCPPANPFEMPLIEAEIDYDMPFTGLNNPDLGYATVNVSAVHVFAEVDYTLDTTPATDAEFRYDTVMETRNTTMIPGGFDKSKLVLEFGRVCKNDRWTRPATQELRRGIWVGTWISAYVATTSEQNEARADFDGFTVGYKNVIDNPAHVCSWDKKTTVDKTPITVGGTIFAETKLSNEARAFANVSKYTRSNRFDDLLEAQREFMVTQTRKTSFDKQTYDNACSMFAAALNQE